MKTSLIVVHLISLLWTWNLSNSVQAATDNLEPPSLPNGRLCYCPGAMENFTCNVVGGALTEWLGTAVQGCSGNVITLAHARFSEGIASDCGPLTARSTSVNTSGNTNCYTSQLTIPITSNLDGLTVNCSRDAMDTIGSHTLRIAAPPPSPTNLMVTDVSLSTFRVTWTEPVSDCGTSFIYEINSDCGGHCSATTSTSGVCSGWTANGQTCSVRVRASLCPGQPSNFGTPVMLILQEPYPPSNNDISVVVEYSEDNELDYLIITFPTVNPVTVAPGLTPNVTYSVQTTGRESQIVPDSSCNATHCQHRLDFPNALNNDLIITVTVTNGISSGNSTNLPKEVPVMATQVANVNVSVMNSSAIVSAERLCGSTDLSVTYQVCDDDTTTLMSVGNSTTVTLTSLMPRRRYCYTLIVDCQPSTFQLRGFFETECNVMDLRLPNSLASSEMVSSEICPEEFDFDNGGGGIFITNGVICYTGTLPGSGHTAQPFCNQNYRLSIVSSTSRECQSNGIWAGTAAECVVDPTALPPYAAPVIAVSIICVTLVGIIVGVLLVLLCGLFISGLRDKKSGTLLLVIILIFVFGVGIGLLIGFCCVKNKEENGDKQHLKSEEVPPRDSLYADPNSIEHQTTSDGTEYAMVDRKVKETKHNNPTQPGSLYQDPNSIEHQTVASGDTYAVVDKSKKGSKKNKGGGPDVVPSPGNEGLTYAEIDMGGNNKRQQPRGDSHHAQQQPGELPVEYSSVDHGRTSTEF